MKRIAFVTSKRYVGVKAVSLHGSGAGLWDSVFIEDIKEEKKEYKFPAEVLIISPYNLPADVRLTAYPKIGFWFTSNSSMEFEQAANVEFPYLKQILELRDKKKIDFIIFGDKSFAKVFDGIYSPYPINTNIKSKTNEKINGIGLFLPPKPSKNIMAQLFAVKLFQKKHNIPLYTNLKNFEPLMKELNLNYKLMGWLPDEQYYDLLSKLKFCLNCTWSETNSYYAVETLLLNTVSLVGPTIDWYPFKDLIVEDISKPYKIAEKMEYILNKEYPCREEIIKIAKERNQKIKEILGEL